MGAMSDIAKGKAKRLEGALTGNNLRKAEGVADEIKGNLKGVARKAETAAKNIADTVTGALKKKDAR
jgi:uncharacterized protein YjbJ (UPF0337 family)